MKKKKKKTQVQLGREESGNWFLYVNGRKSVREESYAVCSNIKFLLEHPEAFEPGECQEVADNIRRTNADE